jgi:protein TonB
MSRTAQAVSTTLHVLFILLLLIWSVNPDVVPRPAGIIHIFDPKPLSAPSGGSGMRQPEPVRKGILPRQTKPVFLMPMIQQTDYRPKLTMPAAVDAPPEIHAANMTVGLPDGIAGSLSGGPGTGLGIGKGNGNVPGNGTGNESGDGIYMPGRGGVSMPVALKMAEPEYSEEGRKARISGSVLVYAEIDSAGHPRNLRVLRGLGLGLDEKALTAVAQWLFKPGVRDGRPVAVRATFEVNFRLL